MHGFELNPLGANLFSTRGHTMKKDFRHKWSHLALKFFAMTLFLQFAPASAQTLCVEKLPVFLCPNSCTELNLCRDTLAPGFLYDSVYIYSSLEERATGSSGNTYEVSELSVPVLCNHAFESSSGWVFGWDSVYISASLAEDVLEADFFFCIDTSESALPLHAELYSWFSGFAADISTRGYDALFGDNVFGDAVNFTHGTSFVPAADFSMRLATLSAFGSSDGRQAALEAIYSAAESVAFRGSAQKFIVLVTNEPPHKSSEGAPWSLEIPVTAAQMAVRNIKCIIICDTTGWAAAGFSTYDYSQLAYLTGGIFLPIAGASFSGITPAISTMLPTTFAHSASFLVFNYPPDSMWTDYGTQICPSAPFSLNARALRVDGAFFWTFVESTVVAANDFSHRAPIDTQLCITMRHQSYWAPDTFDGSVFSDPCPTPLCTTFTLLPNDVVDDGFYLACLGAPTTIILPVFFTYPHTILLDGTVLLDRTSLPTLNAMSFDTITFTSTACETVWIKYQIEAACTVVIDSFAVFTPCVEYAILGEGSYCKNDSFVLSIDCASCSTLAHRDVCWTLPSGEICSTAVHLIADTAFTAFVRFTDGFGCTHFDTLTIDVFDDAALSIVQAGGCAGDSTFFTLTSTGDAAIIRVVATFGDGDWQVYNAPSFPLNLTHQYPASGDYVFRAQYFSEYGCEKTESLFVRQTRIIASLVPSATEVCIGASVLLDASATTVEPLRTLTFTFISPTSETLYTGTNSFFAIDSFTVAGAYTVSITDGFCTKIAATILRSKYADISSDSTFYTISGCGKCVPLSAVPFYCGSGITYGYKLLSAGLWGELRTTTTTELCVPSVIDSQRVRLFAWCADCPEATDSVELKIYGVSISATTTDTILCYGDRLPNLLSTSSITLTPAWAPTTDLLVLISFAYDIDGVPREDTLFGWASASLIPPVFSSYPVLRRGTIKYRFAYASDRMCVREFGAFVDMRHPEAVLQFLPNDSVCTGDAGLTLDASLSYSNCDADTAMCYSYFQLVGSAHVNISGGFCCGDTCAQFLPAPSITAIAGEYTFAVVVCIRDVMWCCDTAYQTLTVCQPSVPEISLSGACADSILLAGTNATFAVTNTYDFDAFLWSRDSCTLPYLSTQPTFSTIIPSDVDSYTICVRADRCGGACVNCACRTFRVIEPVACGVCTFTVSENDSLHADVSLCITDNDSSTYTIYAISMPEDASFDGNILRWQPRNCDVGNRSAYFVANSHSACGEICTLAVELNILNAFTGITGIDTDFGTSCIESASFTRLTPPSSSSPPNATLDVTGISDECFDMSLRLAADDKDTCSCGFWTDSTYFWLVVNEHTGVLTVDYTFIPQGMYSSDIFYSDCSDTDVVRLNFNVPNHAPYLVSTEYFIAIASGERTEVLSIDDYFVDVDGHAMEYDAFEISNSLHYNMLERTASGRALIIEPAAGYCNYPLVPDTLHLQIRDDHGAYSSATFLVWVLDTTFICEVDVKPYTTSILGAYPNPFNASVWIETSVAEASLCDISIFDFSGRKVRTLLTGNFVPGSFKIRWDGKTDDGVDVGTGIYWVRLNAPGKSSTLKITLVR